MRGSALGYSGSMGNGVRMTDNHIYGNGAGIATDTLSAAGHPGFPADSTEIDNNYIYSNNLNLYRDNAPVKPLVGTPVGTGIIYAGVNDAKVHDNWIFDNWRDGVMLFAVPDALTARARAAAVAQVRSERSCGAEGDIFPASCPGAPANQLSTSCNNRFYNNKMGQKPPGFRFPAEVDQFSAFAARSPQSQATMPNGNDFWWDEFSGNTKNCWFGNTGPDGTLASVTGPGGAGRIARARRRPCCPAARTEPIPARASAWATRPRPSTWSTARTARTRTRRRWPATGGSRRPSPAARQPPAPRRVRAAAARLRRARPRAAAADSASSRCPRTDRWFAGGRGRAGAGRGLPVRRV